MTIDKIHCLLPDHDVLTLGGWKPIADVTMDDQVATLKDDKLVYEKPIEVLHYPDYEGKMYSIKNQNIDLDVTLNHRMFVSKMKNNKWQDYDLIKAEDIYGKHIRYKKDVEWDAPDYQFVLPAHQQFAEKVFDMDAWLGYFGIWMAEGWAHNGKTIKYDTTLCINKPRIKKVIFNYAKRLGYNYSVNDEKISIYDRQLHAYMKTLSVGAPNKTLPDWVWKLSCRQSQILMESMILGDGSYHGSSVRYYTSSEKLADQYMQLCLHAGYSANKFVHLPKGSSVYFKKEDRTITTEHIIWRLGVIKAKNNPSVNHGHQMDQLIQEEKIYDYVGPVHCLQVPSEVFYVRRNGKAVWTGNSRSNNGPVVLLTRQPSEGRARGTISPSVKDAIPLLVFWVI